MQYNQARCCRISTLAWACNLFAWTVRQIRKYKHGKNVSALQYITIQTIESHNHKQQILNLHRLHIVLVYIAVHENAKSNPYTHVVFSLMQITANFSLEFTFSIYAPTCFFFHLT